MKTLTVLLILAAVAPKFGYLHYTLDLFSHFKVQYLLLFVLFGFFFVVMKSYIWVAISIAGALFNLVDVAHWHFRDRAMEFAQNDQPVKVLLANVLMHNKDTTRLLDLVRREGPDILCLVEVNQRWIDQLPALREQFPFHFESPHESYRGLALYSRLPIAAVAIVSFGQSSAPSMVADIDVSDDSFQILLTHPVPPMSGDLAEQRNVQLGSIARYIHESEKPVVLVGDLNITMWDRTYVKMVRESQLVNARVGAGIGPTWPAIPVLGIPIDHILVTEPSQAGHFRVHDSIGSDHLPVSAHIVMRARRASGTDRTISHYLNENHDKNADGVTVARIE